MHLAALEREVGVVRERGKRGVRELAVFCLFLIYGAVSPSLGWEGKRFPFASWSPPKTTGILCAPGAWVQPCTENLSWVACFNNIF